MDLDNFTVYVDRLADGAVESLDFSVSSDFLEVNEPGLSYLSPVVLRGQAYIAESELVMCFDIRVVAKMCCTMCNEVVEVPIDIRKAYFAEPLDSIKSGLYNFKEIVRETILLETPNFVKCGGQECKQKAQLAKYLKAEKTNAKEDEGNVYRPFADLNFEE